MFFFAGKEILEEMRLCVKENYREIWGLETYWPQVTLWVH